MRLTRNLVAGLGSSVWTAIIGLAVVPFYLRYLGLDQFGIIGFFMTLQMVLRLLDFGLGPTVNREVARCSATGQINEARVLLHTLASISWAIAAVIGVAVVSLSPWISGSWLHSQNLSDAVLGRAIALMGLVVACRWPINLYHSALVGAQRLTVASAVTAAMVTITNVGAVLVLAYISPTIEAFFVWQGIAGLVQTLVMRDVAWRVIGSEGKRFSAIWLRRIWRFSAGMSGVAVSGLMLMQMDKLVLSRMLDLADFGRYTVAAMLVSAVYVFMAPVFNTVYPRMAELVARHDQAKLLELYRLGTRSFCAVLFPLAVFGIGCARDLILLWTGNTALAAGVAPLMELLLFGAMLHGVMHFPYALQLAYGNSRLPLVTNAVLVSFYLPTLLLMTAWYGALGGAAAWMLMNVVYLFLGTILTHRTLLRDAGQRWLTGDVFLPAVVAFIVVGVGRLVLTEVSVGPWTTVAAGGAFALLAFLIILSTSRQLLEGFRHQMTLRWKS